MAPTGKDATTNRAAASGAQEAKADLDVLRPWYRQKRRKRLLSAVSLSVLLALALSACQDVLTADGPLYTVSVNGPAYTVTNTSSGGNEREALIPSQEPTESSSASCAAWDSGVSPAQNGIIFRGVSASGGWNGVVIERSFYLASGGAGYFIVIYFHGGTFDVGPSVDLSGYYGQTTVWPTRICAQITSDDVLSFAVAKGSDPMVPAGTPGRGAIFQLNSSDLPASGQTGTYVAHIPSSTSLVVGDVTIDGMTAPSALS